MNLLQNTYFIELGETHLPIQIKKHRTARKLIVRYQPLTKSITLTLPQRVSIKQGLHFVNEKREWILRQMSEHLAPSPFCDGQIISVLGKNIRLEHVGGRGLVSEGEGVLQVHGDMEFMERRVQKWLLQKARSEIITLAESFSRQLCVKVKNISLRDTSSRWGSCSADGNLSFSWRLVFAPYEVMSYVVAHEVAHLREHNHSPIFWKLVESICPEYEIWEKWLKKNGKMLYRYGGKFTGT